MDEIHQGCDRVIDRLATKTVRLQERLDSAEKALVSIIECVPQGEGNNRLVSVANYARGHFANKGPGGNDE